ncbi:MAG: PolC-type DNA polymerase III [Bacilli bacterium]
MDKLLQRFLLKIGIKDCSPFEEGSFTNLSNDSANNRLTATIHFPSYLDCKSYNTLFDTINEFTSHGGFSMRLSFNYTDEKSNFPRLLEEFKEENNVEMFNDIRYFDDSFKVLFYYDDPSMAPLLDEEARKLKDFLDSISSSYKILTQERVYIDNDFAEKRDDQYKQVSEKAAEKIFKQKEIDSTYQPCRLKDIENFRMVRVEGTIFKIEDRKTRKNTTIRKIEYTDGSDSISSSLFENKRMTMKDINQYVPGVKIKVEGYPEHDEYAHGNLVIKIDKIEKTDPDPLRQDTYPRKRVELHLHTKMSAFDGLATMSDYAKAAKRYGHKAIAITDHGVCQGFPEAQKAGKKNGIKILYGTEFYTIDDTPDYIFNPSKAILGKSKYVVFDLETTGLSARYDRIIEFGAVRIDSNGQIEDEIDFFINPKMKLSPLSFSVQVSHISQEQVDSGRNISQALKDIKDFFQDAILVGHNVAFDYGFLNEALRNNGMETIKNPVIDTLPLSRYLFPEKKSHTEGSLARELEVEFDDSAAHRANYDAATLSKMFEIMLSMMTNGKPEMTHEDLGKLPVNEAMMKTMHPYHTVGLVKNMAGLKDLYKIISESHINHMSSNNIPLVPKSYLATMRDNLLLGSACLNGEVFEKAMTKSEEDLKEEIAFYDYIEVQPPENYIYLVNNGTLHDQEEVTKILTDLIHTAKDMGKTVCATGDCHYLNPEDKIYRDVFISSKGLKGARHPLNLAPYDHASQEVKNAWYKNPLPNPNQHFRTTDEMMNCFSFLNDKELEEEIVIDNTNKIADMIAADIKPTKDGLYPPIMPGCEQALTDLVYKTAKETYGDPIPDIIKERLDAELHGIVSNGYAVIYWISSLLVRWSNKNGYMIGSRGSVGSSLVATMSGITEVNPLPPYYLCPKCKHLEWADPNKYESGFDLPDKECPHCHTKMVADGHNIPFATFLGFHAEKVPDIDLNFPSDFQSIAHEYMQTGILGKNTVYKAGTVQTTQDKNARGYVLGYLESLGKDATKIRDAEIDRMASGCVDVKRTTGQHPGGVIVIPSNMEVYDFTPVQYPAGDTDSTWKTTHYDFHAIHDNVLKFDMLGHVDPQAVKMQCDMCGIPFSELREEIPFNDPKVISLFWSADSLNLKKNVLKQETGALGLPEFGTETGRRTLLETNPRCFGDLARISGLSHGTDVFKGNAEDLIVKEGMTLRDVIACRDDIMVGLHQQYGLDYNDTFQIMEIVRKGNFTAPGFEEKRAKYTAMMKEHKVPDYYIRSCEKIKYMFPRGHAIAYVMQAVRCAWFKVYHPLEYYATYFTLRCDAYDIVTMIKGLNACMNKLTDIKDRLASHQLVETKEQSLINAYEQTIEMNDRGYGFENLSVSKSMSSKFIVDKNTHKILPPFSCIDGVGSSVGDQIIKAREEQPFTSVEDLKIRGHVSDKMVAILRSMNALDDLPDSNQLTLF